MNNRRNFLKGAGILGAIMGGAAVPVIVQEKKKTIDMSKAPPENAHTIQIMGSYGEEQKNDSSLFIPTNRPVTNSVTMTVGKDNHLWIKVDDQWKRVVLEG